MANATADSVEQAITIITEQAPESQQDELLTVLGVFAERLIAPERFIGLVTKERLMATDLISYLFKDQLTEWEQRVAEWEQKAAESEQKAAESEQRVVTLEQTLRQTLIDVIAARFPQAPITLVQRIQQLSDPVTVQRLITAAAQTSDLAEVERLINEASARLSV